MKHIKKAGKILTIILFVWLAGYIAFAVNAVAAKPQKEDRITDAIVVLTGGNFRIHTGLELFAKGRARHLFISGVNPQVTRREITNLWEGETALPPCCITLGSKSETTIQNAEEVREWIQGEGYTSIRLVTSGYHMPRAMMEFHHALPEVEIIANPVTRKDTDPGQEWFWHITFEEYNKSLYRWVVLLFTPTSPLPKGGGQGEGVR